jgi:glycosyltransferase involved in cell wall biosynthesis
MSLNCFTVVMSVYDADSPMLFQRAVDSVLNQTVKPTEIIIVADGPVGDEIHEILKKLSVNDIIKVLKMDKNRGLAFARNLAIRESSNELIAVMDSDDVCVQDRFEFQIQEFFDENTDVIGGWIEEFNVYPGDQDLIRKTPIDYESIYRIGKWRNPINHVTLMFKKSSYEKVGGYSELLANEDWEMIARMLANGLVVRNIPKVLVHVRGGGDMVKRRRSSRQYWGEMRAFKLMYKCNYLGLTHFITSVSLRTLIRILPLSFTAYLYSNILRKKP